MLDETTGEHNLKHVAAKAVADALADVRFVGFVAQGGDAVAGTLEIIAVGGTVQDIVLQHVEVVLLTFRQQLDDDQLVAEVVKHNHVLEQDVHHVRGVVLLLGLVFHVDMLEISHSVERSVAVETTVVGMLAADFK